MISTVFLPLGVMASLFLASVYPADLPSSCTQICEKYRTSDSAFSLKCEDHQGDKDCKGNCQLCKDICTDDSPEKVYSCPAGKLRKTKKADKSFDAKNDSNSSVVGILLWVVGILVVVIVLIIAVVWYFKTRNKRGLLMGGVGVRPAYPLLSSAQSEQSIVGFQNPVMSQEPSIPSEYQNQAKPPSMKDAP